MTRNLRRVASVAAVIAVCATVGTGQATAAISTANFCAGVTPGSSGFTDISTVASAQRSDIECLAASRITRGTSPTTYGPTGNVFRDSMATFVANLVDTANTLETTTLAALPASGPDAFVDDEQSIHEANINRLAAADIVNGKTATAYGPNGTGNEVTRGQMATFLVAAIDYLRATDLPAGPNAFTDDAGNAHEANINKLAAIDVVDGIGANAYGPNDRVSRAQMASFLVRTLAYLHSRGEIAPLPPSAQSIVVSPSGPVSNNTDAAAGDEVAFTATNIAVSAVDLALFPCENVTVSQGVISFADTNDDNVADPGLDLVEADIVSVNGTNTAAADTETVSGVTVTNGSIAFRVDSATADCVVAVVWDDADGDDRVDLNASNRPTERFGASGAVSFVPPPAASGAMDENVQSVNPANDTFAGCEVGGGFPGAGDVPGEGSPLNPVSTTDCFTFHYDANDVFTIDGDPSSLAEFEAAISPGDDVTGTYNATASGQSRFDLFDEATTPAPADTTAPLALDTELTVQTSTALVDTGDVIQICFDDAMADPADGNLVQPDNEVIRLRDADGTEATLTNGANATFRRPATTVAVGAAGTPTCPSNRVVEIVVGADPQVAVAGTTAGLAVPATIIAATNLENAANIDWAISASGQDVVVDQEAAAEPA